MKVHKLFIILIIALLTILSACSNEANSSVSGSDTSETITLGHPLTGTEESAYQQFAEKFKEIVEAATDGQVTVQIFPNSSMGGEREMAESVGIGTLDSAVISTGPLGNFTELSYILDFPFLFDDLDHARSAVDGEIGNEISADLEKHGMKILSWAESGFASVTTNSNPIKKPEDYRGIVVRSMENEIQMDAYKELGAQPTPMAVSEIYTAMQQGVIDAQANSIGFMVPNRFHEVQEYLSLTEQFYYGAPFIMNKEKLESFTPEIQDIIQHAANEARDYEREFLDETMDANLQVMEDGGITIIPNDEIDIEAFREAVKPVYENYEDEYGEYIERIREMNEG